MDSELDTEKILGQLNSDLSAKGSDTKLYDDIFVIEDGKIVGLIFDGSYSYESMQDMDFTSLPEVKSVEFHGSLLYIPEFVFFLENLEELEIFCDDFTLRKEDCPRLQNLKKLQLQIYEQNYLPPTIDALKNLEILDIGTHSTNLLALPNNLKNLFNLRDFGLFIDSLDEFPIQVCKLPNLETLYLDISNTASEKIRKDWTIPAEIEQMKSLKEFTLRHFKINKTSNIFENFCNMPNLENIEVTDFEIDIDQNQLFPECLSNLTNLKSLTIESANLRIFPIFVKNLNALHSLSLEFDPKYDFKFGKRFTLPNNIINNIKAIEEYSTGDFFLNISPYDVLDDESKEIYQIYEEKRISTYW